ncbi:hypothetical protein ACGFXB_11870 [Streptomyces canus]
MPVRTHEVAAKRQLSPSVPKPLVQAPAKLAWTFDSYLAAARFPKR